jgi:hypothetical protein
MRARRLVLLALGLVLAIGARPAPGAGPLLVNGAGAPLRWGAGPIPWNPDRGPLGSLTNAAAVANVAGNFAVWAAVPTANVAFANAGLLPVDVTVANYASYIGVCGDGLDPIIFDTDGSITDDLLGVGARDSVLGFAGPECGTYVPPVISEGSAVLNGRFIDGVASPSNPEISLADFNGVFVHEFGHYQNLDHSQVNRLEAEDGEPTNDGAVPTMYPFLLSGGGAGTLALDDAVSVSMLYPAPTLASGFGRLTGRVLRADAVTPFQGAYVIARRIGDPRATAVGMASGARYFPSVAGGPPSPSLQGFFELPGLPPGSYTVEVEGIDPAFNGGSSVGPLDPPVVLPGPEEFWSGVAEASTNPPDDPLVAAPVTIGAGATQSGIDIVLNVVPPAPNDECTAATVITATPFLDVVDTQAATRADGDPAASCTFGGPHLNGASVWYRFTPAVTGTVFVDTLRSDYDTVLSVYTGGCAPPFFQVACSDDVGFALQSATSFIATGGTPYLIEIAAFDGSGGGKLEFALDTIAGCGNGTPDAGEACDAGAANGHDSCCSATCRLVDFDGDGRCDRDDVCPAIADPGQADADGDGIGDACDACGTTEAGQTDWGKARLVVSGVGDGIPGNDRLRMTGIFALATGSFSIDPRAFGARIEIRSGDGIPRMVAVLPSGAFTAPGPGWTLNAAGNRYLFRDGTGFAGLPGRSRMVVKDRGGGLVQVTLSASRTTLDLLASDVPLAATVVLGGAAAGANGECGEVAFPGPPPAPSCQASATGRRIVCD